MKKFVKYVYVDVNWKLKVKFKNNKESFFSSISELLDLNDQENNPDVLSHGAEGTNVGKYYCENIYDMFTGHIFVFYDFLHTLAFVSASDIEKCTCGLFLEGVLVFFSLVTILYCFKIWILKTIIKTILRKPITITLTIFI